MTRFFTKQRRGPFRHENQFWVILFTVGLVWHVDGFVAISGWFGIKFKWSKVIKLSALIVFYSLLGSLYRIFICHECMKFSTFMQGGWFGGSYLMLMFVVPFINAGCEALGAVSKSKLALAWCALAVAWISAWAPCHFMTPIAPFGCEPFSVMTLLFVYTTVRVLRGCQFAFPSGRLVVGAICFYAFSVCILGGGMSILQYLRSHEFNVFHLASYSNYCAPHVWLLSIAILVLFSKLHLPPWLSRAVDYAAPSMFGVYLLHDTTFFGWRIIYGLEARLENLALFHPVITISISGVIVFLSCLMVDVVRRKIVVLVMGRCRVFEWLNRIDDWWESLEHK